MRSTTTVDQKKSRARAVLRHFAATRLANERERDRYIADVAAGYISVMCRARDVVEAVHTLRAEFVGWAENCEEKCEARYLLARAATMLDAPDSSGKHDRVLDGFVALCLGGDESVKEPIIDLARALHEVRADLIRWGRDDRLAWERPRTRGH